MLAHLVQTGFGGFYDGLAHWALTPRDLMVVVALALLAGLGGRTAARWTVLGLPVAWLVGGLIGFHLPALGALQLATTLTVGLAGLLVALDRRLPSIVLAVAAVLGGMIHGLANGSVMLGEGRDRLTLWGVVTAVALVTLLGSAAVAALRKPAARIVVRVAGSWIAAIALLLLGWQFRSS
jgi:hydrogenase/urease accessory protein HupE